MFQMFLRNKTLMRKMPKKLFVTKIEAIMLHAYHAFRRLIRTTLNLGNGPQLDDKWRTRSFFWLLPKMMNVGGIKFEVKRRKMSIRS